MVTGAAGRAPVHRLAWAGIAAAVLSGVLALYGSMHAEKHLAGSPLREARGPAAGDARPQPESLADHVRARTADVPDADRAAAPLRALQAAGATAEWADRRVAAAAARSKIANYSLQVVGFVLPFVLGVGACLLGGEAMGAVEQSAGRYAGHTLAVFAMLIGGLGAVVSGCMMVSVYLWPHLPSLYTT